MFVEVLNRAPEEGERADEGLDRVLPATPSAPSLTSICQCAPCGISATCTRVPPLAPPPTTVNGPSTYPTPSGISPAGSSAAGMLGATAWDRRTGADTGRCLLLPPVVPARGSGPAALTLVAAVLDRSSLVVEGEPTAE